MKILYFGSYEKDYPRNKVNIVGLRLNNVNVIECHVGKPKLKIENWKSKLIFMFIFPFSYLLRTVSLFIKGIMILKKHKIDRIIVGFPGHFDIPIAYLLAKIYSIKLIFDPFISLYDTFVNDRKLISEKSFKSELLKVIETLIYKLPDSILIDTKQDATFFQNTFRISRSKIKILYLGSLELKVRKNNLISKQYFTILYQGNYIPLHGLEFIIKAAQIIKKLNLKIKFIFIGSGQTYNSSKYLIKKLFLNNITLKNNVTHEEWINSLNSANILLGIFQKSSKAFRVIPNKVIQGLSLRKPIITADTPAYRDIFQHRKDIYLCKAANPESLVNGIIELKEDFKLRTQIAYGGYNLFKKYFNPIAIGNQFLKLNI